MTHNSISIIEKFSVILVNKSLATDSEQWSCGYVIVIVIVCVPNNSVYFSVINNTTTKGGNI